MRAPVSTAIAMAFGLIVLLGYFFRIGILIGLRAVLLEWAVILAAVALLIGIANLFYVHWRKVVAREPGSIYSGILLFALLFTLLFVGWFGPTHEYSLWLFNYIQVPIEGSLFALLTILLAYAGARLLRRRTDLFSFIFLATAIVGLLATGALFGLEIPRLAELRSWMADVPATAGARGILLGIVLGIVATALRVLAGIDRPYAG